MGAEEKTGFYGNFSSPISLVKRMIGTRDPAAYQALLRSAGALATSPIDRLWERAEKRRYDSAHGPGARQLLVVGGARTGTTFTVQLLAASLQVGWLDNVAALFPRSPITAMVRLRRRPHAKGVSSQSFYGNTRRLGDPNDGFFLWNRWLGNDRYTATLPESSEDESDMRSFFAAWEAAFGTVLLNKNNRNLAVAAEIAAILPNSHFVGVTRDALSTVDSLLAARLMAHGRRQAPWGVYAQADRDDQDPLGYIDDICQQVAAVRHQTERVRGELGGRFTPVAYEDLLLDPLTVVETVARDAGIDRRPRDVDVNVQPPPARIRMSAQEENRARSALGQLGVD